jgi:DNA primase
MNDVLAEIIEYVDDARRYENYITCRCQFHDDSRPSMMIYKDTYRCLSCGAFGRTETLLAKLSKMPIKPHTKTHDYSPFSGWIKRYNRLGIVLKTANETIKSKPSVYLRDRGIDHKTQLELSLGLLDNWYTFPIRNADGKIEGAVARRGENNTSKSKYVIPAGQSPSLLYAPSWSRILEGKVIFITFGILDSISLYLCGVASMSTTTGKQLDPTVLQRIQKHIYIFPDMGEAPEAHKLAASLGWRGHVLSVNYPIGCKDPADLFNLTRPLLVSALDRFK